MVSSGLLQLSWAKISELYREMNQNEEIRFRVYREQQPNCVIIAFVISPSRTAQLLQEPELISASSLPLFNFLCTRSNSSCSIYKSAVTLFASVCDQLSSLKTQVFFCLSYGCFCVFSTISHISQMGLTLIIGNIRFDTFDCLSLTGHFAYSS